MITLASTSPTRQALLRNAGLQFDSIAPDVDERALANNNPHWTPPETSLRLAKAKALAVSQIRPDVLVIAADQVLAAGTRIVNKPRNRDDCRHQLMSLRGSEHQLISSVVCASQTTVTWSYRQTATLRMRDFSDRFLDSYLDSAGATCYSSVGGYQLESLGIQLFDRVDGDYFTILGLPMVPLLNHLRFMGIIET